MMKFMKPVVAASLLGSLAFSGVAQAESTLRIGSWLPPTHLMNADVLPTWGKWVEEATEGRVKVKIEYPGGHPKALLDQVQDGAFEAGWTAHGYLPGRFSLANIAELPNLGAGAKGASVAHWRVHESHLAAAGEHRGVAVVGLFTTGPGQIHLREPIKSLDDMKGKKIRVGGGVAAKIGELMGVEGVAVPGSKVYETLSQGVADGIFMPMGEKRSLRLKEVAPFTVKFPNGGMYRSSFVMFMNEDFLGKLDQKDRDAILSVSGEKFSAMAGEVWDADTETGEKDAVAAGNTIMAASDDMVKALNDLTSNIDQEWIDSVKDRGVDAAAALASFRSIAQSVK